MYTTSFVTKTGVLSGGLGQATDLSTGIPDSCREDVNSRSCSILHRGFEGFDGGPARDITERVSGETTCNCEYKIRADLFGTSRHHRFSRADPALTGQRNPWGHTFRMGPGKNKRTDRAGVKRFYPDDLMGVYCTV